MKRVRVGVERVFRAFVIVLVCVFGVRAFAAEEKEALPAPRFRSGEKGPGSAGFGPRLGGGFERIMGILTEEQKSSFRETMEGQREAVRRLEQKSAESRRELFELALIDKFDEARVKEKVKELTSSDAELTVLRLKALADMKPRLSAEQLEKLRNPGPTQSAGPAEGARKRRPEVPRDENGLPLKNPLPKDEK